MHLKRLFLVLFYLLVFLIPCNLAKHWPQNWSYVSGILVDYLIPTLYLTDILILFLLSTWLLETINSKFKAKNEKQQFKTKNYKIFYLLSALLLFTIYYLLFTKNPWAAFYKLIKLAEFSLFIFWIRHKGIFLNKYHLKITLCLSVIWQSILAIMQWFKQGSVFGYLNFGEQPYSSATLGIKKISFFGQVKVLPMGTFPHPNVLAGFLIVSLIIILSTGVGKPKSVITKLALILGISALVLSFSFPSWLAFLGFIICHYVKAGPLHRGQITGVFVKAGPLHWRFLLAALIAGLMVVLTFVYGLKTIDPASFWVRIKLVEIAFKMWLFSPLMGVGLNNFIVRLEEFGLIPLNYRFLQPVHNIFLLVLSETGIVGFGVMGYGLWVMVKKILKEKNSSLLFAFLSLLFLGLFDHYWLTIQQGLFMLSFVLGLSLRVSTTARKSN